MVRQFGKLSARKVATAKPGKYGDGGNLWLRVEKSGSRHWVFRYTRDGKEHEMGLGSLDKLSLAEARDTAATHRKSLFHGIDPIGSRADARALKAGIPVFAEAYATYIEEHRAGWSSPKHADQWTTTLDKYAKPLIGSRRVCEIGTEDVLAVLQPIWKSKTETATRIRQRIEAVLDAAKARGQRSGENPARWRGHLDKLLPSPRKLKPEKHFAALPYVEAPQFIRELRLRHGFDARALEFLILTASRTGEVINAEWEEIEGDTWTVPPERMKTRRQHRVPLAPSVLTMLSSLPRVKDAGIFPGARRQHLSSGAMDALLKRRMGYPSVTVHGFRATFKGWTSETTSFPNEVSEAALAHAIENKVEAAYRRDDLLPKRRELMAAWANYLDGGKAAKRASHLR